jgi:hypothetical protein
LTFDHSSFFLLFFLSSFSYAQHNHSSFLTDQSQLTAALTKRIFGPGLKFQNLLISRSNGCRGAEKSSVDRDAHCRPKILSPFLPRGFPHGHPLLLSRHTRAQPGHCDADPHNHPKSLARRQRDKRNDRDVRDGNRQYIYGSSELCHPGPTVLELGSVWATPPPVQTGSVDRASWPFQYKYRPRSSSLPPLPSPQQPPAAAPDSKKP